MAMKKTEEDSNKMFGPLTFENSNFNPFQTQSEVVCVLCENTFNLISELDTFAKHLFEVHQLVIEDVQNIEDLPEYIQYWKNRLQNVDIEEIIPSVKVGSTNQLYYLLSTLLKEDKEVRHRLRLDYTLKVQEFERTDTSYARQCLFCRINFEGTRHNFLNHLSSKHNLYLGNPQNLVYIEELVNKIDKKLSEMKCIFCDRVFPERNILKEHMRKKLHKRINERNSEYDRYFIVNYLECGKTWKTIQKEDDHDPIFKEDDCNADDEYSDWNEKEDVITCLLCDKKETNINTLCLHMEADHDFDFTELTQNFDFYQKVKLVNYIRRQIHNKKCVYCDVICENSNSLQQHLFEEQHCKIPNAKIFDQPEFYFPTYENDAFLYLIDDVED